MKTLAAASLLTLLLTGAASGAATTATPAAAPAPNWYNVEIIVFRVLDPDAGSNETWPVDPGMPDWNAAAALNPPNSVGPAVPYQALSPVSEQLGEAWNRLRRSKGYEPLLHVTWTQPALEREGANSQAVRIGVPPQVAAPAAPTAMTPAPAAVTGATAQALKPTLAYGDAKLSTTGPYLHFDLDLVLQGPLAKQAMPSAATLSSAMPAPAAGGSIPAAPAYQLYRLRHDMRVNGGKLAYFDHPLFGAIVLVTPVRH
ncbi:MAG TPA: CsiV family protein [Gammaproteobacteria bacterium]|jgi:hypothetical protein